MTYQIRTALVLGMLILPFTDASASKHENEYQYISLDVQKSRDNRLYARQEGVTISEVRERVSHGDTGSPAKFCKGDWICVTSQTVSFAIEKVWQPTTLQWS